MLGSFRTYLPPGHGLHYLRRRQTIFEVFLALGGIFGVVLDLGCGRGEYSEELLIRGADYTIGIAIDHYALRSACENMKADYIVADITRLPIRSASDHVLIPEVIEHVQDESAVHI